VVVVRVGFGGYSQVETPAAFAELDEEASQFTAEESRKHMKTCIENCWGKLDDYYKILDTLPAYMAAIVLHPGHKLAYIEAKWLERHCGSVRRRKG
jgi:hypothetical protein